MLEIGTLIDGKYRILSKIGQGGMSQVYLAMNEKANKQWAIKELRKEGIRNFEIVRQGLISEIELLKKLNHPNLPSIVDVIERDGSFLIVMDYIEGRQLENIVHEYGAQKQEDVLNWGKQLCHVLAYLHSRKPPIIYRDMKPSNVMLRPDGKVMLIDFGAAREFKMHGDSDTTCLGTQGYAAPEQYGGKGQTDARTDIYCLGATLYHLLTGHNPGDPPYEIYPLRYWNPGLSSGLEEIIQKCTQKNPKDRYQTCGELLYALEHYQELDQEYKKKQRIRWKCFCFWIVFTVIMTGLAVGFAVREKGLKKKTYEVCVEEANNLAKTDPKQCVKLYEDAVRLNPKRGEAYQGLLHFFLWQNMEEPDTEKVTCVFSSQEEQKIREILGRMGEGDKTNEEYLKMNRESYERFSYDLGMAYFYSYNGTGNKIAARKWLGIAQKATSQKELNLREINRARGLYQISGYYDSLGIRNQAGDSMISYGEYWEDLKDLVAEEKSSNLVSMLLAYKEMLAQIVTNVSEFQAADVSKEQIMEQLDYLSRMLRNRKIVKGTANAEYEQELMEEIQENLPLARRIVDTAYDDTME